MKRRDKKRGEEREDRFGRQSMIRWKFEGLSIIIEECPRCGREGALVSYGRKELTGDPILYIKHKNGGCNIGRCSEYYDELRDIYEKVNKMKLQSKMAKLKQKR